MKEGKVTLARKKESIGKTCILAYGSEDAGGPSSTGRKTKRCPHLEARRVQGGTKIEKGRSSPIAECESPSKRVDGSQKQDQSEDER